MRVLVLLTIALISITGCSKSSDGSGYEDSLVGKWVAQHFDTLTFQKNNGQYLLTYGMGFNDSIPDIQQQYVYRFDGTTLSLIDEKYAPGSEWKVNSFKWNFRGKSFNVQTTDLFPIMSAMYMLTYVKIE